jgi:hypothetical protein
VPLSIHEVYKKNTKTGKRKGKTPAEPKNMRKPKHPSRNQLTKPKEHYMTAGGPF